jgi:glutamyl-tRNA synthetase/glutamyl-Q tRNA(Asp) synthetase
MEPGVEAFVDLLQGAVAPVAVADQGDPAIRDRHGNWTYTFAVVVDDLAQGIDLVIRGDDLRDATAGQIRLARMIGRAQPATFAHHPVLMKSPTRKLSKADGDTGIGDLRREGWTPARLIGHAAARAGLVAAGAELAAAEAGELFSFTALHFASG